MGILRITTTRPVDRVFLRMTRQGGPHIPSISPTEPAEHRPDPDRWHKTFLTLAAYAFWTGVTGLLLWYFSHRQP